MPRVISGTAGSIKLLTPEGIETRPTSDRVKEAFFSILAQKIHDCNFLDLYAGSGQMGIESLSRGGKRSVFIEHDRKCREVILHNLKKTGLADKAEVLYMKTEPGIKALEGKQKFDIIYIDPPYKDAFKDFEAVAGLITQTDILNTGGIVALEHSSKDKPSEFVINLQLKRSCKYGSVMVSFYENKYI